MTKKPTIWVLADDPRHDEKRWFETTMTRVEAEKMPGIYGISDKLPVEEVKAHG